MRCFYGVRSVFCFFGINKRKLIKKSTTKVRQKYDNGGGFKLSENAFTTFFHISETLVTQRFEGVLRKQKDELKNSPFHSE